LHSLVPEGQVHVPLWHCLPDEQSPLWQQWELGMHWPLHSFVPEAHWQVPLRHCFPLEQSL